MALTPVIVLHPSVAPHNVGLQLEYDTPGYAVGWTLWAISGCCEAHMQWDFQPRTHCRRCGVEPKDYIPAQSSYFRLPSNARELDLWAANWTGLNGIHVDVCIES